MLSNCDVKVFALGQIALGQVATGSLSCRVDR